MSCIQRVHPSFIYLSSHQPSQMTTSFLKSILIGKIYENLYSDKTDTRILQKLHDILIFIVVPVLWVQIRNLLRIVTTF